MRDPDDEGEGFEEFESLEPGQFVRIAWIFYLLMSIAGVVWMAVAQGKLEWAMFVQPSSLLRDLGLAAGAALLIVGAWHALRPFFRPLRDLEDTFVKMIGPIDSSECFVLALISGFSEEIFFRGAMQGSFGWIAATLLFGIIHTGPGAPGRVWTVFALIVGAIFAQMTIYTGNLSAAIVAHVLVNWIQFHLVVLGAAPQDDMLDS